MNPAALQMYADAISPNGAALKKLLSNRDSVRKAREAHLILKANTLEPYGLNISENL